MRIRKDADVYEDAAVLKASASLLGEYYIAVAPGTEGRRAQMPRTSRSKSDWSPFPGSSAQSSRA